MAKTIPGEDSEELDALTQGILKDLNPLNTHETELVNQLIDLQWRLRRVTNEEARILSQESPDYKALNHISLHGARLKRQYSAGLKDFQALHKVTRQIYWDDLAIAEKLVEANQILNRPTNLEEFGFVFPLDLVERSIRRRKLIALTIDKASQAQFGYKLEPGEQEDLPLAA